MNELLVKPLPSKLPRVSVYLDAEMKKDLETLAKLDKRSVSNRIYAWVVDNIESAKREGKLGDRLIVVIQPSFGERYLSTPLFQESEFANLTSTR